MARVETPPPSVTEPSVTVPEAIERFQSDMYRLTGDASAVRSITLSREAEDRLMLDVQSRVQFFKFDVRGRHRKELFGIEIKSET